MIKLLFNNLTPIINIIQFKINKFTPILILNTKQNYLGRLGGGG